MSYDEEILYNSAALASRHVSQLMAGHEDFIGVSMDTINGRYCVVVRLRSDEDAHLLPDILNGIRVLHVIEDES